MQLDAIVDTLRQRVPGCVAIYLFGSHATGGASRESDVDLAVLAPAPLGDEERWHLAQRWRSSSVAMSTWWTCDAPRR